MSELNYKCPSTIDEATKLLATANSNAKILAGGTDLLVQLRMGMINPELIVDIKKIKETIEIKEFNGGYRVGAAVSGAELGEHEGMKNTWPGVV